MPSDNDKYRIVPLALIGVVVAASIAYAILLGQQKDSAIRQSLSLRSQTIAAALGDDHLAQLAGESSDSKLPAYSQLKARLATIKGANRDVRSIYIAGERSGRVFLYVDSETAASKDHSPAGTLYTKATPAFKAIFETGKPFVEGPVRDEFGTFISGLAPILKPNSNDVAAVIGVDISATTYWRDVGIATLAPLLTGLSLVVIIGIFEWIRRRNLHLLAIRSELVSVASHELRTPITGIRWAAESLQKTVTDEKSLPMIRAIHNSASTLQASADDILELTHEMNHFKVQLAATDMTKLVGEVFDTQQLTADQKGVTLKTNDSWPEDLVINCDADKMKRVMQNMISNAIKYTRDNTEVTVGYQQDATMHRILVSDQGIGIPSAEQDNVLRGGYRASNAVASKVQGTGLGLYLVKTVLEQHGGKVSFISEEGQGTTFILYLPKRK
jgi:signal transduction histidine kinase